MNDYFSKLLLDNQTTEESFSKNPAVLKSLECFHYSLPIHPFEGKKFDYVTTLRLIEEDVVDLEYLKLFPNLQELTIIRTQINQANVKCCPFLIKLFIDDSKLTKVPDISDLSRLQHLSIAGNPIRIYDSFPKSNSLLILNISSLHLKEIPPSISNFPNLEELICANNDFSDFSSITSISSLSNLKKLNIYDPLYGDNPICSFPNYRMIMISLFQQLDVLDTYIITSKEKSSSLLQHQQVSLYYTSTASSAASAEIVRFGVFKAIVNNLIKQIPSDSDISKIDFSSIYKYIDEAQIDANEIAKFSRDIAKLEFVGGGKFSIKPASSIDASQLKISSVSLIKAWNFFISETGNKNTEDEPGENGYMVVNNLNEVLPFIGIKQQHFSLSKEAEISDRKVIMIIKSGKLSSILFFSENYEDKLSKIKKMISSIPKLIPPEVQESSLFAFRQSYELSQMLTSITLIDCSITSLSMFESFKGLTELRLPFNSIQSLSDLPDTIQILDVSFNKISEIPNLVPSNPQAADSLTSISIYGNPVCSPKVLLFIAEVFPHCNLPQASSPLFYPSEKLLSHSLSNLNSDGNKESKAGLSISNSLKDIRGLYEKITVLSINSQCISSLASLAELPNLKTLDASDNDLYLIDFGSDSLRYADFSLNGIRELPVPDQFPSLVTLLLNCNQITQLTPLPNLSSLFLGQNPISEIPYSEDFPKLECLFITNTPLIENVGEKRLIFQLPNLKMLNGVLVNSSIRTQAKNQFSGILFKEEAAQYADIPALDLSDKNYVNVDALQSKVMINLSLAKNKISQIKWDENSLPKLQQLCLASNSISSVSFVHKLPLLRFLDLSAQNEPLGDEIINELLCIKCPELETLNLSNNRIKSIPKFEKQNFPHLKALSLSHNFIQNIAPNAFDLESLRTLDLSYNTLRKLDNIANNYIEALDLSHNRIPSVDEVEKLKDCLNLKRLGFSDNPLTQRIPHKIRCLCILRGLIEIDGHTVNENDNAQVMQILGQNGTGVAPPLISGKAKGVQLVQPNIQQPKRKIGDSGKRYH